MKKVLITILILAVIIVGGYFVFSDNTQKEAPSPTSNTSTVDQNVDQNKENQDSPENNTTTSSSEDNEGNIKEIAVKGSEYKFEPKTLTVEGGSKVRVNFDNVGDIPHNFVIPTLGVRSETVDSGGSDSFTFSVPEKEGKYEYSVECTLPGHKEQGMVGTLIVN